MTTSNDTMPSKKCAKCDQDKPLSEFYIMSSNGKPSNLCKGCSKERTSIRQKQKLAFGCDHERKTIEVMKTNGIYAQHGREVKLMPHVDIVAWGCVPVEVKLAQGGAGHWAFHFSGLQQRRGILGKLIVLIIPYEPDWSYYVFDVNKSAFYRNGKLKTGVTYTENPTCRKRGNPLYKSDMDIALNRWELVEVKRQEYIAELLQMSVPEKVKVKQFKLL